VEYALAYPFLSLVPLLPERVAQGIGRLAASAFYAVVRSRQRVGDRNLALAYPELGKEERRRLLRRSYSRMARTAIEVLRMPRLGEKDIRALVRSDRQSLENFRAAERRGKGLVMITAHLGNWELLAIAFSLFCRPAHIVARPRRNPWIDRALQKLREGSGNVVCAPGDAGALRRLLLQLRSGGVVGILADHCPRRGVIVPFFGRDTLCHPGPARLALQTGAALVPAFLRRDGDVHVLHVHPAVVVEDLPEDERNVERLTQRLQSIIEAEVRAAPEDWLWTHRRWKRVPSAPVLYS
jgi:KDO2-lipid IV(A) lauroyltransferase